MKFSSLLLVGAVFCLGAKSLFAQNLGSANDGFDPNANGSVRALAVQGDGKILVGGGFTSVGGETRNGLARIHPDGSVDTGFVANVDGTIDPTLNPASNNWVLALAVESGGDTLVGGGFTSIDGAARNRLARLKPDGTVDATFDPNVNGTVLAIALQADGRILIGGHFTSVGGVTRNYIARLEANGALDTGFHPGADGPVAALAVEKDGSILAGGSFGNFGGSARSRIARVSSLGVLDPTFAPAVNGEVRALLVQVDRKIVIGGDFTTVGGETRNRIARLAADGSVDPGFDPDANEAVNALTRLPDGRILTGGMFTQIGGLARDYSALLAMDGSADADFDPDCTDAVHCHVVQGDDRVVIGGDFGQAAGETRNRLARFDGKGRLDEDLVADIAVTDGQLRTVMVDLEGRIVIGGSFTEVGGVARANLARLFPDGTVDPTFNPGTVGPVNEIAIEKSGSLIVVGNFTEVAGQARNRIARLFVNGTLDATFDPNANDYLHSAAIQPDGKIVIAGNFTQIGTTTRTRFARLLPDGSLDPGFNPFVPDGVGYAIELFPNGRMRVSGSSSYFVHPSTGVRTCVLGPDGALGFFQHDNNPNGQVYAIAHQPNGDVLVGGGFDVINNSSKGGGTLLAEDGGFSSRFLNLSVGGGTIYGYAVQTDGRFVVAGRFSYLSPDLITVREGVGRITGDLVVDAGFDPGAVHSDPGTQVTVYGMALQSDGKLLLAGNFDTVDGQTRVGLARVTAGPAFHSLEAAADGKSITWSRTGANAKIDVVDFDLSLDGGVTWHELGRASRVGTTSSWTLAGLNLPKNRLIQLRARGYESSSGSAFGGVSAYSAEVQAWLDGPQLRINEVDALTQAGDTREFIELYDGGAGNTPLDGLAVVLFGGATDTSYHAIDLDGQSTDANGYFVIGNAGTPNVDLTIPDGTLQNGADAVGLFEGDGADFPNGTPLTVSGLIDAVVYGTGGETEDAELLDLLLPGQMQIDENGNGSGLAESLNRLPNGGGFQRETMAFFESTPTPGAANLVPVPMNLDLTHASDSGVSMTDDLTNDDTPTISGKAIPGSAVVLTSSLAGETDSGIADGVGNWQITPTVALNEGIHVFTATAGTSAASDPLTVTIDTTRPGVTVEIDPDQPQTVGETPVQFDIAFDETVAGFEAGDVTLSGSAGPSNPQLTMEVGNTYGFSVLDVVGEGEVIAAVAADVVSDAAGNGNLASTSVDNVVEIDLHGDSRFQGSQTPIALNAGVGSASGWLGLNGHGGSDFDVFSVTVTEARTYRIRTTGGAATIGAVYFDDGRPGGPLNRSFDDDDRGDGENFEIVIGLAPGDYVISVAKDDGFTPGAAFLLEIESGAAVNVKTDLMVGPNFRQLKGRDRFKTLVGQQVRLVSRKLRRVTGVAQVRGEIDVADQFLMRCPAVRGNRFFRCIVRGSGGNGRAALARGDFRVTRAGAVSVRIVPNRRSLSRRTRVGGRVVEKILRKVFTLRFYAASLGDSAQWDNGVIRVLTR